MDPEVLQEMVDADLENEKCDVCLREFEEGDETMEAWLVLDWEMDIVVRMHRLCYERVLGPAIHEITDK